MIFKSHIIYTALYCWAIESNFSTFTDPKAPPNPMGKQCTHLKGHTKTRREWLISAGWPRPRQNAQESSPTLFLSTATATTLSQPLHLLFWTIVLSQPSYLLLYLISPNQVSYSQGSPNPTKFSMTSHRMTALLNSWANNLSPDAHYSLYLLSFTKRSP